MKAVVIILVLIAASFVAVLVVGVGRHGDEAKLAGQDSCRTMPPLKDGDGDINEDALNRWKDRCLSADKLNFADRFAKGVKLRPAAQSLSADSSLDWAVPRAKDGESAQQVKLTLQSGSLVKVEARPAPDGDDDDDNDIDDQSVCLCNGQVAKDAIAICDGDWQADNVSGLGEQRTCKPDANHAKLYFGPTGGTITLSADRAAQVTSAK